MAIMAYFRVVCISLLLVVAVPAYGQYPYPFPPPFDYSKFPPIFHPVPLYGQDTMAWCWVAAAKMVADYYQWQAPNQCEMLRIQYGAPCCENKDACTRPGHIAEIQALVARFGGHYSSITPPADGFSLYRTLQRAPLILHTRQGAGHFVVATGMKIIPTNSGPLGMVSINDPSVGSYEIPFPNLIMIWDMALVVY